MVIKFHTKYVNEVDHKHLPIKDRYEKLIKTMNKKYMKILII